MSDTNRPSKEHVKHWLDDRVHAHKPLPDMKTIRRELGWDLIESTRQADFRSDIQNVLLNA